MRVTTERVLLDAWKATTEQLPTADGQPLVFTGELAWQIHQNAQGRKLPRDEWTPVALLPSDGHGCKIHARRLGCVVSYRVIHSLRYGCPLASSDGRHDVKVSVRPDSGF